MKESEKYYWISALRSGEYIQGRGSLCNKDKYCCLGVLCAITNKNMQDSVDTDSWGNAYYSNIDLPDKTQKCLIDLNDFKKKSFNEIADWIELNIPTESEILQ